MTKSSCSLTCRKEAEVNRRKILQVFSVLAALVFTASPVFAENIDPYEDGSQYAYSENAGWLNFEPNQGDGVHVSNTQLTGFVWAENIGWVNLSPTTYGGVGNDWAGNLSGFAWGENVGWINFDPNVPGDATHYGVTIDNDGNFDGWAWGENVGWINFGLTDYYVVACKVTFEDLANFVDDWLTSGIVPANLDDEGPVDFEDYSIFASYWLDYCPDGWQLK